MTQLPMLSSSKRYKSAGLPCRIPELIPSSSGTRGGQAVGVASARSLRNGVTYIGWPARTGSGVPNSISRSVAL
eukprot:CAMPEP_0117765212 /NCGR_PEP_ID=MMETSP0947-20121206/19956_1 /TAXON_ID=44440 /ORGANISM="Chattonella subsalsa, Strain CCMP2191" /LENGTH=73 /DNA_ID=CAMNT_0005587781 /DNA_START=273 /DNA_END=491 /DNA_ORIENTATION=-